MNRQVQKLWKKTLKMTAIARLWKAQGLSAVRRHFACQPSRKRYIALTN